MPLPRPARIPVLRPLLLFVAGLLVVATGARPAAAAPTQSGSEEVASFDSTIVINRDGSADVTEVIVYDFGYTDRHGIVVFSHLPKNNSARTVSPRTASPRHLVKFRTSGSIGLRAARVFSAG